MIGLGVDDLVTFLFMLGAYLIVPALLARFLVRARWVQVALAFQLFWLALFLLLGFGRISEEVFGWTLIMAMFLSVLGVPLAALALRLTGSPKGLR